MYRVHSWAGGHRKGRAIHHPPVRPVTSLHVPQPCAQNWDAMLPTATGRHCAACAKTVVDFTLKTDAEILAYLARTAGGRTCGRFAAGQLARPLQRAVPVAPAARWRAWLAAVVAVWAVRESAATEANAQTVIEWRARYGGGGRAGHAAGHRSPSPGRCEAAPCNCAASRDFPLDYHDGHG